MSNRFVIRSVSSEDKILGEGICGPIEKLSLPKGDSSKLIVIPLEPCEVI